MDNEEMNGIREENTESISEDENMDIENQSFEILENEIFESLNDTGSLKKTKKNSKVMGIVAIVLLCLIFVGVVELTVHCIVYDIKKGVVNDFQTGSQRTQIVLETADRPESNEYLTYETGEYTIEGLAKNIRPQVVEIFTYSSESGTEIAGSGSGIIISSDGYIVTNTHVINSMKKIVVNTYDGNVYVAEVVGKDTKTDIAVIKVEASGLSAAVLGDSDQVVQGEKVVAIGNPAGLTGSITDGIVSGLDRKIKTDTTSFEMNCIQTNAAISPGNSGGALVNMYGQVIGITSSKYAAVSSEGLGFAIAINDAVPIIEELITQGYVSGRVKIGITFYSGGIDYTKMLFSTEYNMVLPEELEESIWVSDISKDCDIANTKLRKDDFIVSVNGVKVSDYDDLNAAIDGLKGGDTVKAVCARVDDHGNVTYFDIEFKLMTDTSGDF